MLDVSYDAILVVGFGGPEAREDVVPFLQKVLRGKRVPHERLLEVAEHYYHFGGVSPINAQTRGLIDALRDELSTAGVDIPVYWGNRNWHPLLADVVREMANDGVSRALAWVMSAYSSYSGCRQYLENIESARVAVGSGAPQIDKVRVFYNHPGFLEAATECVRQALDAISSDRISQTPILYTAHSIPLAMAENCSYQLQLQETAEMVSRRLGHERYQLAYQSRSGPPSQPWLEPDVRDVIRSLSEDNRPTDVVIAPIGFLSDHLEVLYDLDVEAKQLCDELGINMVRAGTAGTHPRFVRMIRELIVERITPNSDRPALGKLGPSPDVCPPDCCRYIPRRPSPQ